jgi:hypothetical protein
LRAQAVDRLTGHVGEVDDLPIETHPGRFGRRQRLKVLHQPRQADGLVVKGGELAGCRLHHAVAERFGRGLEHGDGCAQLVGDVCHHGPT